MKDRKIDFQVLTQAGLQICDTFNPIQLQAVAEEADLPFSVLPFLCQIFLLHSHAIELNQFVDQSKLTHFESGEAEYQSEVQMDLTGETK